MPTKLECFTAAITSILVYDFIVVSETIFNTKNIIHNLISILISASLNFVNQINAS
jgi:hypothetical protein